MSTVRKTISLTERQDKWVKSQIADGKFANDSEVVRAALIQAEAVEAHNQRSYDAIEIGMNSPRSTQTLPELFEELKAKYKS